MQTISKNIFCVIKLPNHCMALQLLTVQFMSGQIFECEQSGQGQGNAW